MKVLLIDDGDDIRRIATLSLSRVGHMEVVDAKDGEQAVAVARRERPDVILLDVMMPGVDGPAVLKSLQSEADTARIPVVFLTASALSSEVKRLKDLGARGVLTKPFDPIALPEQVRAIVEQASQT